MKKQFEDKQAISMISTYVRYLMLERSNGSINSAEYYGTDSDVDSAIESFSLIAEFNKDTVRQELIRRYVY